MRVVLLAAAAVLCVAAGFLSAEKYRARYHVLCEMVQTLQQLKIEIGFSATPLSEAAKRIASGRVAPFWNSFCEHLVVGEDASAAWQSAHRQLAGMLSTRSEDILTHFANGLGKSDRKSQCNRIDECIANLDIEMQTARKNASEKSKLRSTLGVMCGLAVVVILF